MKLPFKVDLADKVAVITGAGGVICSEFARAHGAQQQRSGFRVQPVLHLPV